MSRMPAPLPQIRNSIREQNKEARTVCQPQRKNISEGVPMDIDAKLRPLYLTKILRERTDEDHYLTTPQLCAILKEGFGIEEDAE